VSGLGPGSSKTIPQSMVSASSSPASKATVCRSSRAWLAASILSGAVEAGPATAAEAAVHSCCMARKRCQTSVGNKPKGLLACGCGCIFMALSKPVRDVKH
jgi:hypothetical protein